MTKDVLKFEKSQIVNSKKYKYRKDIVNAVLKDGQNYTTEEVDGLIDKFLKGKVIR